MKTKIGIAITILWTVFTAGLIAAKWDEVQSLTLNEWGDYISGMSAMLALFWLVLGYFQQSEELRQNTKALQLQQKEMSNQVKETQALVANSEKHASATIILAEATQKIANKAPPVTRVK